jgi:Phophatidylserine decarboxylase
MSVCANRITAPAVLFGLQCLTALLVAIVLYVRRRKLNTTSNISSSEEEAFIEKEKTSFAVTARPASFGEWLPPNGPYNGPTWLTKILADAETSTRPLHSVLRDFQSIIEEDPILFMLFTRMFTETPEAMDPIGRPEVKDYKHMIQAFNVVISMGPPWAYTTAGEKGAVGAPITTIINWAMGTEAGREAFLNPVVNAQIKNMLTVWGQYLTSYESTSVLDASSGGWLCEHGKQTMGETLLVLAQCLLLTCAYS